MPEIDPKTLEYLAESITFHVAGMTTGTGHLDDFGTGTTVEKLQEYTKNLLSDPDSKFFINHSNNAQRGGAVYI